MREKGLVSKLAKYYNYSRKLVNDLSSVNKMLGFDLDIFIET